MQSRLFIHATNVHQGGGRALLDALLKALPSLSRTHALLDSRMPIPVGMPEGIQIKRVAPSMTGRCWSSCGSVDWRVARCRQLAACLGATAGAGYLQEIIEYKAIDRSMRPIAPWLAEELHSTEPVHIGTALGCTLPSQSLTI